MAVKSIATCSPELKKVYVDYAAIRQLLGNVGDRKIVFINVSGKRSDDRIAITTALSSHLSYYSGNQALTLPQSHPDINRKMFMWPPYCLEIGGENIEVVVMTCPYFDLKSFEEYVLKLSNMMSSVQLVCVGYDDVDTHFIKMCFDIGEEAGLKYQSFVIGNHIDNDCNNRKFISNSLKMLPSLEEKQQIISLSKKYDYHVTSVPEVQSDFETYILGRSILRYYKSYGGEMISGDVIQELFKDMKEVLDTPPPRKLWKYFKKAVVAFIPVVVVAALNISLISNVISNCPEDKDECSRAQALLTGGSLFLSCATFAWDIGMNIFSVKD